MGLVTYNSNGKYPGHKLKGEERYSRLYHYTSFDAFVKIWLSKTLRFSSIRSVNDVLERIVPQVSNFDQMALLEAYVDIRPKFKQISLTMDYDSYMRGCMSPCMWGYYADKKKGVCIELDYHKLPFNEKMIKGPITYKKYIPNATHIPAYVSSVNQLLAFIKKNAKSEFLTKHISWKGENEYRIISRYDDYLDISDAISAVYLTSYNSDECLFVEKLVNDSVPVKYLHYNSQPSTGYALPVMTDTKLVRKQQEDAINNPDNVLQLFSKQSHALYEKHKGDLNYSLIIDSLKI